MGSTALVFSGFVASLLTIFFFQITRSFRWTSFSPTILLGCLVVRDPRHPFAETIGYLLLLVGGSSVGALLLRYLQGVLGVSGWPGGVVAGGVMGLFLSAATPVLGMNTACSKGGALPPPGYFGVGWGKATPVVISVGCALYGAALAAIHAGF